MKIPSRHFQIQSVMKISYKTGYDAMFSKKLLEFGWKVKVKVMPFMFENVIIYEMHVYDSYIYKIS